MEVECDLYLRQTHGVHLHGLQHQILESEAGVMDNHSIIVKATPDPPYKLNQTLVMPEFLNDLSTIPYRPEIFKHGIEPVEIKSRMTVVFQTELQLVYAHRSGKSYYLIMV